MDLLSVSPQELTFYAPYDQVQRRILTLLNPTNKTVLFKISSNAFRHYGLMPTAGKVKPYDTTEIRISLRCFDFQECQQYRHKFSIHSAFSPVSCLNGENLLAIFQRLPRREFSTKSLPVKLEAKPLSLSKSGLNALPCLKQLVMERNQQLKPLCPKCPEMLSKPSKPEKPPGKGIKSMVIIVFALLAVILAAYLQREQMTDILINFYPEQMDCSQDSFQTSETASINCT